jgi:hypothetical protein
MPTAFARVRPRRVGSVGSAPSARHVGGYMFGASSGGGAAAGPLRCSQRGPRARDVTEEYSRGIPSNWVRYAGTVGAHGCCGCGVVLLPERPSPLRVCRNLTNNELTGSVPSSLSALTNLAYLCVPPSCQRRLRACARGGSDRSALLRARGMSGGTCLGHRAGAVRQQGRCGAPRGDLRHAM